MAWMDHLQSNVRAVNYRVSLTTGPHELSNGEITKELRYHG